MGILDTVLAPVLEIINKVVPDKNLQAQIALQMAQLQQNEEFKQLDVQLATLQAQTDTNKVEAANSSIFIAGWRPFVGWICGFGLGYQILLYPFLVWFSANHHWVAPPEADMGTLITMLGGLLGLGSMRTVEKIKGVNSGH